MSSVALASPTYTATEWREAIHSTASEIAKIALSFPGATLIEHAPTGPVAGAHIALVGRPSYELALVASPEGCVALSSAVLGMDITGMPARVIADAIGELVNMLAGGIKRRLAGGSELELGLPLYVTGAIEPSGRQSVVTVPVRFGTIETAVMVIGPARLAMRGIVFLMFESFVIERRGYDAYEDLLDAVAGRLDATDPFIGAGTYRDDDLLALVDAEADASASSRSQILRELGSFCFPRLAKRYAWVLAGQRSLPMFMSYLRRTSRDRAGFALEQNAGSLRITYRSPPSLCVLGDGLLDGVSEYFATPLALAHVACVDRGDPSCVWEGAVA